MNCTRAKPSSETYEKKINNSIKIFDEGEIKCTEVDKYVQKNKQIIKEKLIFISGEQK